MKSSLIGKKFHVCHHYLKAMNILQISRKSRSIQFFFANQNSLIKKNGQLPPTLSYKTNERLSSVKITDDEIFKIIAKLDPNTAHAHDKISIRMTTICSTSIWKTLRLIFNHCIDDVIYPCEWKKASVVFNRPVFLLPICCKIFERLLYSMFDFFLGKNLVSANQSGFKP